MTDRRSNSRHEPRKKLAWPKDKPFRILSLDGGGIRGVYTALLLDHIQDQLPAGRRLADHFDLIAGTSTGGIIAVGLGMGLGTKELASLYLVEGRKIFPPWRFRLSQNLLAHLAWYSRHVIYDHRVLESLLFERLGNRILMESSARLVIPSFMLPKAEIAVFKTDHHPDYEHDHRMAAWEICRATSAAPTYFKGHERNGRMFVDGGLWANDPASVAVTEALTAFDVDPSNIKMLSIGTGGEPWSLTLKDARKGWWAWKKLVNGAMYLSTNNAGAEAALRIGSPSRLRIEPEQQHGSIDLGDWAEATKHLPDAALLDFRKYERQIMGMIGEPSEPRHRYSI